MKRSQNALHLFKIDAPYASPAAINSVYYPMRPLSFEGHPLRSRDEWLDADYRRAYMEAAVEEGIAWQIKVNRKKRKLTQAQLAERIGAHQQSVSRLEDPSYGRHSLDTLVQLAHAFDCALMIRFISYSQLAEHSENLGPESLFVESFQDERCIIES